MVLKKYLEQIDEAQPGGPFQARHLDMSSSSSDALSENEILGKRKQSEPFRLDKLPDARGLRRWETHLKQ